MRAALLACALARVVDFAALGAVPDDAALATAQKNGGLLNTTLAGLRPGDELVVPNKTFHVMGGIVASGLKDVVVRLEGTLAFSDDMKHWPRHGDGQSAKVLECLHFTDFDNVTFTSSGTGVLDGQGSTWWGFPGIGYLERTENRPRLVKVSNAKNMLFENWHFVQSPYWTFTWDGDGLEVRNCEISARRSSRDEHDVYDLTAFNTDGFDVSGKNVWIHDSKIWNQDDCIAVKGDASDMLFERLTASGLGLTIGSEGGNDRVNNITFRDCDMPQTYKGIYLKVRTVSPGDTGLLSNILYENIVMDEPEQWAIWIGPAQQSDSRNLCAAHPCSICWPKVPFSKCEGQPGMYENITLRNVTINNPKDSPGVLLGDPKVPMKNVVFDGVKVHNPGKSPWGDAMYKCEGVEGVALGGTDPVPPCFKDRTQKQVLV